MYFLVNNNLKISGIAQIFGSNILDLIDEASGQYVLPNDVSLSNLIVEKIMGIGFPEYVMSKVAIILKVIYIK